MNGFRSLSVGISCSILFVASMLTAPAANANERYLGEIILVGFNFCPRGTLATDGSLLPISSNSALFSLLGTMYGGDGRTTFALPDLRSKVPIGDGKDPTLSPKRIGDKVPISTDTKTKQLGGLVMKYCIVVNGIYPSRS